MKKCSSCKLDLPETAFKKYKRGSQGLQAYCRSCNRNAVMRHRQANPGYEKRRYLIREWGMTEGDYEAMLQQQGGCCLICGSLPKKGSRLHIDHNHQTGYIRGLLCYNCNDGLGRFRDSPELLHKAIAYLGRTSYGLE